MKEKMIEAFAKFLYETYCEHSGGAPGSNWVELLPKIRNAWRETAKSAMAFSIPAPDDDGGGPKPPPPPPPPKP
jgi:hypothetical protein